MDRRLRILAIKVITGPSEASLKEEVEYLQTFAGPNTTIEMAQAKTGTASIENFTDMALAGPETLRIVREAEREGFDGAFITCWGNANLDAAREVATIPVTASGEASMLLAACLGARFSVIATLPEVRRRHELEAYKLGVHTKFASERPLGVRPLELEKDWEATKAAFIKAGRKCIEKDGAEVLIPGCFGFIGLASEIQEALGVPVIEPAGAVVRHIETLALLGLCHSKKTWPTPRPKQRDYGFNNLKL
jgi:allantoin racemase